MKSTFRPGSSGRSPGLPGRGKTTHKRSPSGVLNQPLDERREAADSPLAEDPGDGPADSHPPPAPVVGVVPEVAERDRAGRVRGPRPVDGRLPREGRVLGRQVGQAERLLLVVRLVLTGCDRVEGGQREQERGEEPGPANRAASVGAILPPTQPSPTEGGGLHWNTLRTRGRTSLENLRPPQGGASLRSPAPPRGRVEGGEGSGRAVSKNHGQTLGDGPRDHRAPPDPGVSPGSAGMPPGCARRTAATPAAEHVAMIRAAGSYRRRSSATRRTRSGRAPSSPV